MRSAYLSRSGTPRNTGQLSAGMGGRFGPEWVATLKRNRWQLSSGISIYSENDEKAKKTLLKAIRCFGAEAIETLRNMSKNLDGEDRNLVDLKLKNLENYLKQNNF